jgi:hypothetical protein
MIKIINKLLGLINLYTAPLEENKQDNRAETLRKQIDSLINYGPTLAMMYLLSGNEEELNESCVASEKIASSLNLSSNSSTIMSNGKKYVLNASKTTLNTLLTKENFPGDIRNKLEEVNDMLHYVELEYESNGNLYASAYLNTLTMRGHTIQI